THAPQFSALGAVLIAAIAVGGMFVPSLVVALARVHWIAVWLGSAVLLVWLVLLFSAYGIVAYTGEAPAVEAVTGLGGGPAIMAAIGIAGTVATVIASVLMSARAPIRRYG